MTATASPADQAAALSQAAGVRTRDDLMLVRVSGDDRRSWLNGQVTNDVRGIEPGQSAYALAVTVRGKIMADVWVLDRREHLALLLPKPSVETVLESFERQIIMEDVELGTEPELCAISVQGPRAREVVSGEQDAPEPLEVHALDELGHGGLVVLAPEAERTRLYAELVARAERVGGGEISDAGFELARLRAGRPRFGHDFTDRNYPQEAGLKALAVSFQKGCYLGQEVVCTLENRGRLTRRLVRLATLSGPVPEPGSELRGTESGPPGRLTSVVYDSTLGRSLALGYVKRAQSAPGTELSAGETRLQIIGVVGDE